MDEKFIKFINDLSDKGFVIVPKEYIENDRRYFAKKLDEILKEIKHLRTKS